MIFHIYIIFLFKYKNSAEISVWIPAESESEEDFLPEIWWKWLQPNGMLWHFGSSKCKSCDCGLNLAELQVEFYSFLTTARIHKPHSLSNAAQKSLGLPSVCTNAPGNHATLKPTHTRCCLGLWWVAFSCFYFGKHEPCLILFIPDLWRISGLTFDVRCDSEKKKKKNTFLSGMNKATVILGHVKWNNANRND